MKYLKFTYVDAVTGISVASQPAANGPAFPAIAGLEFVWARESRYPTSIPEFFGTCPAASSTQVDGVLGTFSQADWETMQADELAARQSARAAGRRITRLAFRNRFTQAEKVALEIACLDDPAAAMAVRQQAAALRVALADQANATYIDLDRADTRAGVQNLETLGLLGPGRAAAILDAEVQAAERFGG